uniref:Charged multivesicular body protein 1B n=1 Tax=Paramormyrops kingsleyae TaxID=1676925 RepID=A0A3B3QEW1_9TELE
MSNMEKHLFNLKFAAKELQRNSKKCDKEEKTEKAKVKKAIQKGNMEVARIHFCAPEGLFFSSIDFNFFFFNLWGSLMDKFEQQFETLDVQTAQMEDTMSSTTTLTTPQNEVESLMHEMADEAGLELNMELPQGQTGSVGTSVASTEQVRTGPSPAATPQAHAIG